MANDCQLIDTVTFFFFFFIKQSPPLPEKKKSAVMPKFLIRFILAFVLRGLTSYLR